MKYDIRGLAVWFEQKRNVHGFAACHEKGVIEGEVQLEKKVKKGNCRDLRAYCVIEHRLRRWLKGSKFVRNDCWAVLKPILTLSAHF